jgi:hypothetical protein
MKAELAPLNLPLALWDLLRFSNGGEVDIYYGYYKVA